MEATPESVARVERDVYSVSRLNREVRTLLERGFGMIWLEGEISNFSRPSSGHWYFSLKDAGAQVRCAMFRQRNMSCAFTARDGQKVLVRARIGLYEPRGEFQLLVEHMEDAGLGALRRRFDELAAALAAEGLFAPERKRPLPALPKRIGVVTSPTGAALRDILHVLARRFPAVPVLIYPVAVQGAQAAAEIVAAIQLAGKRAECDVLILARGGGSLEDLWAFNDERLARVIAASSIPVISGVGHEIDFTIADFAADVRAPTPSAAAELAVPDALEWLSAVGRLGTRLERCMRRNCRTRRLEAPVRRARRQARSRGIVRARAQAPAARSAEAHRRHHLADRRGLARCLARARAALCRRARPHLSRGRAGRCRRPPRSPRPSSSPASARSAMY